MRVDASAAEELLARGYGRPAMAVEMPAGAGVLQFITTRPIGPPGIGYDPIEERRRQALEGEGMAVDKAQARPPTRAPARQLRAMPPAPPSPQASRDELEEAGSCLSRTTGRKITMDSLLADAPRP